MIGKRVLMILFLFWLAACSPLVSSPPSWPTPESTCPTELNWNGVVPGKSTRQDLLRLLGGPAREDTERFPDGQMSFYAYTITTGKVAGLAEDRFFFRKDGVVAWIEAVVADRDGQTHTVEEVAEQLGSMLDQVYVNNNLRSPNQFDVLAGPDQIYVWAECGLAVSAAPSGTVGDHASTSLTLRHPVHPDATLQPSPDVADVILFKFFFPPTSFSGFEEFYEGKVPYYPIGHKLGIR